MGVHEEYEDHITTRKFRRTPPIRETPIGTNTAKTGWSGRFKHLLATAQWCVSKRAKGSNSDRGCFCTVCTFCPCVDGFLQVLSYLTLSIAP